MKQTNLQRLDLLAIISIGFVELFSALLGAFFFNLPVMIVKSIGRFFHWLMAPLNDSGIHADPEEWPLTDKEKEKLLIMRRINGARTEKQLVKTLKLIIYYQEQYQPYDVISMHDLNEMIRAYEMKEKSFSINNCTQNALLV